MHLRYLRFSVLLTFFMVFAFVANAQAPWRRTIELKDRRETSSPVVATAELSAYFMRSRLEVGTRCNMGPDGNGTPISFAGLNEGFIKFKIDKIRWIDEAYDETRDFKVVVRSLWVDMNPRVWTEIRIAGRSNDQLRRQFINAPNVEYVKGDSLPPPFIFKVNRDGNYAFTVGFKTLTPGTFKEKPFDYTFRFRVNDMLRKAPVKIDKTIERPETIVRPPIREEIAEREPPKREVEDNTSDIDRAIALARENQDIDRLIELIGLYPKVQSAIDARNDLTLLLRRELLDSTKYRIDIQFKNFTKAIPKRDQIDLAFALGNRELNGAEKPFTQWIGDNLYVRPPRDGRDYKLIANVSASPENKGDIILNSLRDYIRFSYKDTLENSIQVKLGGGTAPFTLRLEKKSGDQFINIDGGFLVYGDTLIDKDRFARAFDLPAEGDYRLFVVDADQLRKTGRGTIYLIPPPPIPPVVWYSAGAGLLLFLFFFFLWSRRQRKKDEEMEKLIESRGGRDPKVKRKPKPNLISFWEETAISDLALHKNFIDEIAIYLKERPKFPPGSKPVIEGVLLGTVLKFDFENEQYEVRIDRFRAIDPRPIDHYIDSPEKEKWPEIKEVLEDHRELVKIGWLQVVEDKPMRLTGEELQFQDEQFSELFQLLLKVDIHQNEKTCGFFTRTTSGKLNNAEDRREEVDYWMDWEKIEYAGYYENSPKPVKQSGDTVKIKNSNRAEWA